MQEVYGMALPTMSKMAQLLEKTSNLVRSNTNHIVKHYSLLVNSNKQSFQHVYCSTLFSYCNLHRHANYMLLSPFTVNGIEINGLIMRNLTKLKP